MMQKINIKNTTKTTMYAMLCAADKKCEELEDSYRQLKNDSSMRIDHLSEDLAATIKENGEMNRRLRNLEEELKWCIEHPWKHLWWCLRGKNHEA